MTHLTPLTLGDVFEQSKEKGVDGAPLLSVTLHDGLVDRGQLERKQDTNLVAHEHLLVREGYIAYNMMRVWQGALGRSQKIGLVSPAYVVLAPKENICSQYMEYLFKSSRMIYLFWAFSYGLTKDRLRLYYKDFSKIKIELPSLKEQQKISEILSTWDKAITTTGKLIENSQQQKKALMQQLLTGKKRLPGFSDEWKKVELGKLLDYKQPTPYLVKSTEYSDKYETPVLTAGKTFILGYTNETDGIFESDLPVIIFDDFTTASKFVDFPFKAKSSAMKILIGKKSVSTKFIFEAMQMMNYPVGGHQRHWISIFSNLVVNIPCYEEQKAIASILAAADSDLQMLRQKLSYIQQEKKALIQQLLTGKKRVKLN